MIPFIDLEGGFLTTEELLFLAGASGGGGVEHTIINNPATFTTDMAKPLRKLLIPFTPVQSGSGDPSPSNIRPITGWTGLNINRTGVNVWDEQTQPGYWSTSTGAYYPNSPTEICSKNYIPVFPGTTYCLVKPNNNGDIIYYDKAKQKVGTKVINVKEYTFTTSADCYFITFNLGASYGATYNNDVSINYPSSETEYFPYSGTTVPVSWQTDTGEVYGGTLDALTGVLTVDRACITDDGTGASSGWSASISSGYLRAIKGKSGFTQAPKNNSTANLLVNYMKSSSENGEWCAFTGSTGNFLCYVNATTFPDKSAWLAYLAEHPLQICYELEEPFTVQLDPVTLSTLIGENVIWTDTNGDNTIVYLKKT